MAQIVFLLIELLLLFCCVSTARKQTPLISDDSARRPAKSTECQFGKSLHEMGSTWFADLGPPFGVMYCIKCECIPIQKKRRIVARVQCRNIKNECPKPSCDEPVLYPGRCCKVCPDDHNSPDVVQDTTSILTPEEEERNMKHFATLLTGRTSSVLRRDEGSPSVGLQPSILQQTNNNIVATGRFTFHRKNLYYSFYVSDPLQRPRALQFSDHEGNILEEQALIVAGVTSVYQNVTGKVCGVWRRVPRGYRRLLREEKMYISLLWGSGDQEYVLSGQVARYRSLSTELFSSLMQPAPGTDSLAMNGAGGTAIVSASSSAPSIHISVVFNGVFSPDDVVDIPLIVRLESQDKQQIVLEEEVKIQKPSHELNVVEVQTAVSSAELRLLTRGKLIVSISSKKKPTELRLEGKVITRATCEIFQGVLASSDSDSGNDEDEDVEKQSSAQTLTSGMAWMYMSRDGSLVYSVQLDELSLQDSPMLVLVSGHRSGGRRSMIELEDLTPSLVSGWANGTIDRMSPRELEQLYAGELSLNVATRTEPSLVRGRLAPRPMADARDSHSPVLLKRQNETAPATLTGMSWLAVDSECSLHYEIVLSGLTPEDRSLQLYLKELPFIAPGAPVTRKLLEEFKGGHLEGFVMSMSQTEFLRIDSGVSFLEVQDQATGSVLLKARLKQVAVPLTCFPNYSDNDVPGTGPESSLPEATTCYHEMRFYEEGAQWTSKLDPCIMCNCHHGHVKCDTVPCPPLPLTCTGKPAPGECCPTCTNSSASQESNTSVTRGCYLAGQFYPAASSWHPYLPPSGFDLCAVCTCDANTLEVQCPRMQCPPLTCNEHDAFRPDKKACCKQCPPVIPEDSQLVKDQQNPNGTVFHRTFDDILASGGCNYFATGEVFENGHEWHPRVHSHGEVKCVKCRCKDGTIKCERKRCLRSSCSPATSTFMSSRRRNNSQSTVNSDECCSQCRRNRRHHRPAYNS